MTSYQTVSRRITPCRSITCKSGISCHNLHLFSRSKSIRAFLTCMIGPGHCRPQALIFNGSLEELTVDSIELTCGMATLSGTGTGATAAE